MGETSAAFDQGIYSPVWTERTYAECLRRVEAALFEGGRVIVDASFRDAERRQAMLDTAARWGVPATLLVCHAEAQTARTRLAARTGDASDADWAIYQRAAKAWEQPGADVSLALWAIRTDDAQNPAVDQALAALQDAGLWD